MADVVLKRHCKLLSFFTIINVRDEDDDDDDEYSSTCWAQTLRHSDPATTAAATKDDDAGRKRTIALELVRRRGQQQLVLHVFRSNASRNARLLVALLDPVRQPLEVAVAVQRVASQCPAQHTTASVYWEIYSSHSV